ncbi:MAG: flagellar biosynthetic protein FliO [Leptospiraceae bacterium]|nr:flagellar biosynthetic protein FliO [Leptospiraceae bacterium]
MKAGIIPIVILALTWGSLYSQEKPEDLDSLLQEELGVTQANTSSKSNTSKDSTNTTSTKDPATGAGGSDPNVDLIQNRYSDSEDSSSTAWLLIKVILVFGGLTAVMMFILRVMTRTRDSRFPVKGVMSVLSSLPIAPNKQIQIVDVAGKLIVLGVADSGVNYITEITSLEDKNRILKLKQEFEPSQDNFMVTLLESLKDLSPKSLTNRLEGSQDDSKYLDDSEIEALEQKHKRSLEKLKDSNKDLGMDPGFSGGKL